MPITDINNGDYIDDPSADSVYENFNQVKQVFTEYTPNGGFDGTSQDLSNQISASANGVLQFATLADATTYYNANTPNDYTRFDVRDDSLSNGEYIFLSTEDENYRFENPFTPKTIVSGNGNSSVLLIGFKGQSNCEGRVPIANASAFELEPQNHFKIWNGRTQQFEPLDIPTNNKAGFNQYGAEVAWIKGLYQKYGQYDVRLVKHGVGNTLTSYWTDGGEGKDVFETGFLKPAIQAVRDEGKQVNLVMFFHQGEANNSSTFGNEVHLADVQTLMSEDRADYGDALPFVFGGIVSGNNNINQNYRDIANSDELAGYVEMEGQTTLDGIHFDDTAIRVLGNGYLNENPLPYGVEFGGKIPDSQYYYVRNAQKSIITGGLYDLLVDLEYIDILTGDTEFLVDDVLISTETLTGSNTEIIKLTGLTADGNTHTLKIRNKVTDYEYSIGFDALPAAQEGVVNIDFSGYTVPTTDPARFEDWKGTYEIAASPEGSNGIRVTSDTGGIYTNTDRATVRFKDVPLNIESTIIEFDLLRGRNDTAGYEGYIGIKSSETGGNKFNGYLLRMRSNSILFYKSNDAASGIQLLSSHSMAIATLDTWRRYRMTVTGFSFKMEYFDGSVWVVVIDESITEDFLIKGNFSDAKYLRNSSGDILTEGTFTYGATGVFLESGFIKDVTITT